MIMPWKRWSKKRSVSDPELEREIATLRSSAAVPLLWLFGKTGSGKSSIVRTLTGSDDAIVGEGFRPETKYSSRYDFPNSEEPLLKFLDTRGIGEAHYDPQSDLDAFSDIAHLLIVTVRVADHALDCIVEPLRKLRRHAPHRPVLLVLTCLHEAVPQVDISSESEIDLSTLQGNLDSAKLPEALVEQLRSKMKLFDGLVDRVVAVDLTKVDDGFHNPNYGANGLKQSILELLPKAYRQSLIALSSIDPAGFTLRQRRAKWQILASSCLAATAGAMPIPWCNMPLVLAIQSRMAVKVASIYEQTMDRKHWTALTSAAGTQIAVRLASRELLKFVPFVGMAAGAASAFAFTYALGMACDWYFAVHRQGRVPSSEELRKVFSEQLSLGHRLWGADKS